MRSLLIALGLGLLTACQPSVRDDSSAAAGRPDTPIAPPSPAMPPDLATGGPWLTERTALPTAPDGTVLSSPGGRPTGYALLGKPVPAFSASLHGGGQATQETLRGHWTILAFWGAWSEESLADARYISALITAAGQDPDLDVLTVHGPRDAASAANALGTYASLDAFFGDQGAPWPTVLDADGAVRQAFGISWIPSYVLVGPDLTVRGFRTDLSLTPDNGIKDVIRGVAEIRAKVK